jgi:hypothetical protein
MDLWLAENEKLEMKKAKVDIEMRYHMKQRRLGGVCFHMGLWLVRNETLAIQKAEVEVQMRHHMKKLRGSDNDRTTIRDAIVKAKRLHDPVGHIDEQVGIIAKRMYLGKHGRLPMKTRVFRDGTESSRWIDAYVEGDMPILEAAHDEFMSGVERVVYPLMDEAEKKWRRKKQDTKRRKLGAS